MGKICHKESVAMYKALHQSASDELQKGNYSRVSVCLAPPYTKVLCMYAK